MTFSHDSDSCSQGRSWASLALGFSCLGLAHHTKPGTKLACTTSIFIYSIRVSFHFSCLNSGMALVNTQPLTDCIVDERGIPATRVSQSQSQSVLLSLPAANLPATRSLQSALPSCRAAIMSSSQSRPSLNNMALMQRCLHHRWCEKKPQSRRTSQDVGHINLGQSHSSQ